MTKFDTAVLRNSIWNVAGLAVSMTAALFYIPYLVRELGVASYGMVPLISGLFVWVSWISLGISWSVGRYVTIARTTKNVEEENRYFNSAFLPSLLLAAVILSLGILLAPFADRIVRVPEGGRGSVIFLWTCSAIVSSFSVLNGTADVGNYSRNRFDIRAIIQISRTAVMILTVLALFRLREPRLEWVGIGTVVGAGCSLGLSLLSLRFLLPEIKMRLTMFSWAHFREMISTNAWILVDQLGTILLLNVDLFLVNRFFGAQLTGEYGLAIQWVNILKALMTAITVFTPTYVIYVAKGDLSGLATYATKASRFVGYMMAIPIGVVLGLADPLTRTWLRHEPGLVSALVLALTLPLTLNAAINPLYGVWQALNKVRTPSFATLAAGISGIVIAIILIGTTSLGVFAIAIAVGIAFTARNLVFSVHYVGHLLGQGRWRLIRVSLQSATVAILLGVAGRFIASWTQLQGWLAVGLAAAALTGLGTILVWFGCLSSQERKQLMVLIVARLHTIVKFRQVDTA